MRDEIIPEVRMKMYDSISEEKNKLKLEIEYQMQALRRESSDASKKDKIKN